MRVVQIIMTGKPLAKGRPRFTRSGHSYTPARTVAYEGQLALAAQEAMDGKPPVDGPLSVLLDVQMPIAISWSAKKKTVAYSGELRPIGRPDLDNFAKMLDALNFIVWNDDAQIVELHITKRFSLTPQMEIIVDTVE